MLNENTVYGLVMENYAKCVSSPDLFAYFGTMDDILKWKSAISEDDSLCLRYQNLIAGIDSFDMHPDVTHVVSGQEIPILSPVEALAHAEVQMDFPQWDYSTVSGVVYPMQAKHADVSQLLLKIDMKLCRCVKVCFDQISVCLQCGGWIRLKGETWGAPQMLIYEEDRYCMRMYVCAQIYDLEEYQRAVKALTQPTKTDLEFASHDVIGLGMF